MLKTPLGLYIHIPFCLHKCRYCDFYSLGCAGQSQNAVSKKASAVRSTAYSIDDNGTLSRTETDDAAADISALRGKSKKLLSRARRGCGDFFSRYIDALLLQMEDYRDVLSERMIDTIYIGGGTPTVLPSELIEQLTRGIYTYFPVAPDAEITIEANPATVNRASLKHLLSCGINRLSLGVQSACEGELSVLGRLHSFDEASRSFKDARSAGFENISVDLMFGIPNQTPETLSSTLRSVIELEPEHISLYDLKIEPGTPFASLNDAGALILPDEDAECEMYYSSIKLLAANDYHQYEISNFARKGRVCQHNLRYWTGGDYLGLGPGAHSCFGGRRFSFRRDIDLYIDAMEQAGARFDIIDESAPITESSARDEFIMLALRTTRGIDLDEYTEMFGTDFEEDFAEFLPVYVDNGFMTVRGNCYALTPKGMYVSNYIIGAMAVSAGRTLD